MPATCDSIAAADLRDQCAICEACAQAGRDQLDVDARLAFGPNARFDEQLRLARREK